MKRIGKALLCLDCLLLAGGGSVFAQNIGGVRPSLPRNISDSLKKEVAFLTSDALKGRGAGSEGEKAAATHVYEFMQNIGAMMLSP